MALGTPSVAPGKKKKGECEIAQLATNAARSHKHMAGFPIPANAEFLDVSDSR